MFDPVDMSIRNHAHAEGIAEDREAALEAEVIDRMDAVITHPELSPDILEEANDLFVEGALFEGDFVLRMLRASSSEELLEVAKEMKESMSECLEEAVRNVS